MKKLFCTSEIKKHWCLKNIPDSHCMHVGDILVPFNSENCWNFLNKLVKLKYVIDLLNHTIMTLKEVNIIL